MNEDRTKQLYNEARTNIMNDPQMAEHILKTDKIISEHYDLRSAPRAIPNKFMMVFKSDVRLGDTVSSVNLNLATNEVSFVAIETGDYKWTDWLLTVPEDESVTLFLMDDTGKHRCQMVMDDIYLFEHTCSVRNQPSPFGIDSLDNLEHKVTVQFGNIERLHPEECK